MNAHLTELERHDAAYGFSEARHRCPDCDRGTDAIRDERRLLGRALSVTAPSTDALKSLLRGRARRSGRSWMMLPAAGLFVALLWMLSTPGSPPAVPAVSQDAFAAELGAHLSSASSHRRDAAAAILRRMSGATLPLLDRLGTQEARTLAAEIRDPDPALTARLRGSLITFKAMDIPLGSSLRLMLSQYRIQVAADPGIDLSAKVDLDFLNHPADKVLAQLLTPLNLRFVPTREGRVRIFDAAAPPVPELAPLLLPWTIPPGVDRWIADLGSDDLALRHAAAGQLEQPGAIKALWKACGDDDAEIASSACAILKRIHGLDRKPAAESLLEDPLEFPAQSLEERLEFIASHFNLSYACPLVIPTVLNPYQVPYPASPVLTGNLKAFDHRWELSGTMLTVLPIGLAAPRSDASPAIPWMSPELAGSQSALIASAARGDKDAVTRLAAAGPEALPSVRHAQRFMNAPFDRIADAILSSAARSHWFVDEPPAWKRQDLKDRDLDVRRLLEKGTVSMKGAAMDLAEALKLLADQLRLSPAEPGEARARKVSFNFKGVTAGAALEALIRPMGLEAVIEKGRIVIR